MGAGMRKLARPFKKFLRRFASEILDMYRLGRERPAFIKESSDYFRISTLELIAAEIHENCVEGSVAEFGVYRGDFARLINKLFPERKLYLFDTFKGFDERDLTTEIMHSFSSGKKAFSDTSVSAVLHKMDHPQNVVIREGYFPETAQGLENEQWAFVSIDADLYDPIYAGLEFFYPNMCSGGGGIMVHDYNNADFKGTKQAVRDFCLKYGVPYCPLSDLAGSAVIMK
jgi:O-methyltransferase